MAIFIFGLISFQSYVTKAEELSYIETQTQYSKQLILDPDFDEELGNSPWNSSLEGDISDVNVTIGGGETNYTINGEQFGFTLINSTPHDSDWTAVQNPKFPILPDSYGINQYGINVSHEYNEWVNQTRNTPSMNWKRNINLPSNMSDYEITSASLTTVVNGSALVNVETPTDTLDVGGYHGVDDFVRFYVLISDLNNIEEYELAYNRTVDLGIGDSPRDSYGAVNYMYDTNLTTVDENLLIFYLQKVLEHDNFNFTITLGIDVYCEDNYDGYDRDTFRSLLIKSIDLSFTYRKKINRFTSISVNQTGNSILSADYEVFGSNISMQIDEAKLNFKFKSDKNWSEFSPNSEFRIYINDSKLSETVKLIDANSNWKNASINGFDVLSNILIDNNVSINLQLYIADDFILNESITVSVDEVILEVTFTVTVRTDKIDTILVTTGSLVRFVTWNESFQIEINYTDVSTGLGITGANFSVDWVDSNVTQEDGDGIYTIICNNTNTISGQTYFIDITVEDFGYLQNSLQVEVRVDERETEVEIFMDGTNMTLPPVIELPITSILNVTATYFDSSYSAPIDSATFSLYGIGVSSFNYSVIGFTHQFLIDTEKLGLGTKEITLVAEKFNYVEISTLLSIKIVPIQTNLTTIGNIQSTIVTWDEKFFIDVNYVELESGTEILNANFTANWIGGTPDIQELSPGIYRITCESNNTVSGLIYALEISVDDYLYEYNSLQVDVNVLDRETDVEIFMDNEDVSLSPVIELPITSLLNVTALYYDLDKSTLIQNATVSLYGILEANYFYTQEGDVHQFIIDTMEIGLGTHLISLVLENQNFDQISTLLRITVVPIQMNGTIRDNIQSVSISPGSDYLLEIQLRDEFGDLVQNIEVNYTWDGAPGTFTYNETSGYYTALLSDVPEGVFDIIITAEKGPNYDFEEYRITISSTTKLSVWQLVLIYFLAALIIALISGFGAYQLHYKYPPMVRDVRKLRRKLRKGKKTKSVMIDSREKIMEKIFQDKLRDSNIKSIKVKKIDQKLVRTDKDIKEITGEDLTKKPEKPITDKKLPEKTKEKEKVEKLPDKKSEKEIAEIEKKLEEKAEKEKIAKEKAAKKAAKKEQKLKEKTAEKEKSVMEKIAKEAAVKAKKIQEKPIKVGKKEEAKVKMSKISLPKKKDKK